MIEVEDIFVESLFTEKYDDIDHQKILNYIDFLMNREEKGVVISNKGGWQYHVNYNECDAIDDLSGKLTSTAHQILYEHYGFDIKDLRIGGIWINVNNSGDYNVNHNHAGSLLSSCYYLQVPDENSAIEFEPHDQFARCVFRNEVERGEYKKLDDDFESPRARMGLAKIPQERQALFFNGALMHRVDINNSVEPRISIAANFISYK